jgi:hypothetical protein
VATVLVGDLQLGLSIKPPESVYMLLPTEFPNLICPSIWCQVMTTVMQEMMVEKMLHQQNEKGS